MHAGFDQAAFAVQSIEFARNALGGCGSLLIRHSMPTAMSSSRPRH